MKKVLVILGPTGSGKTALAIKLAQFFKGEIISADSRQIYQEMIIGTNTLNQNIQSSHLPLFCSNKDKQTKLKMKELEKPIIINGLPHYLLQMIPLSQNFNVAIYKKVAIKVIKKIQAKQKLPILVGGTGLYLKAITDNLSFIALSPQLKLRKELEKKSKTELIEIYQKLDPQGINFIEKNNKRRLIRGIEVCQITKKSFWQQRTKGKPLFDILEIGIEIANQDLKEKITKRTNQMLQQGLEQEVKKLVEKYGWNNVLSTTIGYQEWKEYFEKKIDLEQVVNLIISHTIQFSKRQKTWFKRNQKIKWVTNYLEAKKLVTLWQNSK